MNWSVFGKAFLVETVYSIPFFILSILPFKKQLRFQFHPDSVDSFPSASPDFF